MRLKFLVSISILFSTVCVSQTITGIVLEAKTNAPIESASVYFDNTTIGTSTDANGKFEITNGNRLSAPLIISFLGYAKVTISDYRSDVFYKVLLEESPNTLDEVLITSFDGMSRELKLKIFRKEFLGVSKTAQSCVILNEDDIILRYDKRNRQLSAYAKNYIEVNNKDLQYLVSFEIEQFKIDFSYVNLANEDYTIQSLMYKGTSLYQSLDKSNTKKVIKNRDKAYKGSVLHFMRALSKQKLKEEKYTIASGGFIVEPEKYISVSKIDSTGLFKVRMRSPLSVFYKDKLQSDIKKPAFFNMKNPKKRMTFKNGDTISAKLVSKNVKKNKVEPSQNPYFNLEFYIDNFGNHSPIEAFYLIGYMGNLRVGDSLPSDYNLQDDK